MKFLGIEDFAQCVNQSFDVSIGDTSVVMSLVSIRNLKANIYPGMFRDPFALTFKSAALVVLPQKIYKMKNASIGEINIFICPVGRDVEGIIYEAIYN